MTRLSLPGDERGGILLEHVRERRWTAVRAGDEHGATATVCDIHGPATGAESVLLDATAPVQVRVGAERAANRLTVAQEHTATASHEAVVAAPAPRPGGRNDTPRGLLTPARARAALAGRAPTPRLPGPGKPA
ncbi:B12-binding domain-containing protein [Streptomyces sp. NPDC001185]|uniref:B12-binding domain-containing protein n=1 Tax=Streptomyces sp. NPDC001185 TaxID=3154380 RepID=UPI00332F31C4